MIKNGQKLTGVCLTVEPKTELIPQGASIIFDPQAGRTGTYYLMANDVLNTLAVSAPTTGAAGAPARKDGLHDTVTLAQNTLGEIGPGGSIEEALAREEQSMKTMQPLGVRVSVEAQALYTKFSQQFPKNTRWACANENDQDFVVMGVLVKYPYDSPACFEATDENGQKAVKRIRDMASNFSRSALSHTSS